MAIGAGVSSCGRDIDAVRSYEEIHVRDTAPELSAETLPGNAESPPPAPAVAGALRWSTPEGWEETPGTGMRLASFKIGDTDNSGQCTIVILSGAAGGLEANVKRWIGQLGLQVPEGDAFRTMMDRQETLTTRGGFPGVLVDLIELSDAQPGASESMIAGVITAGARTVFVKFTGPVALLNKEKENLASLCRSLSADE